MNSWFEIVLVVLKRFTLRLYADTDLRLAHLRTLARADSFVSLHLGRPSKC